MLNSFCDGLMSLCLQLSAKFVKTMGDITQNKNQFSKTCENNCLLAGCQLIVSWDQCFGYLDQLRTMNAYMNESWVIFFECTPACELRGTALSKVHVQLAKKCAFRPQAVLPRLRKARLKRAGVALHAVYRDLGVLPKGVHQERRRFTRP